MKEGSWRPLPRLRQLQGVALRRFAPGNAALGPAPLLYFDLFATGPAAAADSGDAPNGGMRLLYTSEPVPLDFDLVWDGPGSCDHGSKGGASSGDSQSGSGGCGGGGGPSSSSSSSSSQDAGGALWLQEPCTGELLLVIRSRAADPQRLAAGPCCNPALAAPPGNRCPWGDRGLGDGWGANAAAGVSAAAEGQDQQQHKEVQGSRAQEDAGAATTRPAVLTYRFRLDQLRLLPSGGVSLLGSSPQPLNELVLHLPGGQYAPLPLPDPPAAAPAPTPSSEPAAAGPDTPRADGAGASRGGPGGDAAGGGSERADGGSGSSGSGSGSGASSGDDFVDVAADASALNRQPSLGRAASVAQQQQFFRWILSNSTSVLGGMDQAGSLDSAPSWEAAAATALREGDLRTGVGPLGGSGGGGGGFALATAASGGGGVDAGAGCSRVYDAREFAARTRRLLAQREQLAEVQAAAAKARAAVAARLHSGGRHAQLQAQRLALQRAQHALDRRRACVEEVRQQLEAERAAATGARRLLDAKAKVLREGADALRRAHARLEAARAVLEGEAGHGQWRAVHAELVARRNRLVSDLGALFQIGPAPADGLRAQLLAAKLEDSWWAANTGGLLEQSDAAAAGSGGGLQRTPESPRLQICGLELRPDLAKRGLQGALGWDGGADEEQRVAAALGCVALATQRIAAYLGVPLRFPLRPAASRSAVLDPAPVHQQAVEEHTSRLGWGLDALVSTLQAPWQPPRSPTPPPATTGPPGSGPPGGAAAAGSGGSGANGSWGAELPLYYDASDRTRFAYALFLLNKDIEQLLHAHGLSGSGPHHLLANLHALVSAARSGLPHSGGGGGDSGGPHAAAPAAAGNAAAASSLAQQLAGGGNGGGNGDPMGARPGPAQADPAAAARAAAAAAAAAAARAAAAAQAAAAAAGVKMPQPRAFDWGDELLDGLQASGTANGGGAA